MLSYLLKQLLSGLGAGTRVLRAYISRFIMGIWTRVKRLTQVARGTTRVLGKATKTISQVGQKPSKREDFVETRSMYISKSFLIILVLVLLALAAIIYLLVVPWAVSRFGTARMADSDRRIANYDGKVVVYYDKEKKSPEYEGRLEQGKLEGEGRQYDREGQLVYEGNFTGGLREGYGKEYTDGLLRYSGSFAADEYAGEGKLYEKGLLSASGVFSAGKLNGEGFAYYSNGSVYYSGTYVEGKCTGTGTSYYSSGGRQYTGEFVNGVFSGSGTFYDDAGAAVYTGTFADGVYSGSGVLLAGDGFRISGEFENGVLMGAAEISKNGYVYYAGSLGDGVPDGYGTLSAMNGNTVYEGPMRAGTIDGAALLGLSVDEVRKYLVDSAVETAVMDSGFTLTARELGLTVFFSFQSSTADAMAYDVSLMRVQGADAELSALLWRFTEDTDRWLRSAMGEEYVASVDVAHPQYSAATASNGVYDCAVYQGKAYACTLWSEGLDYFIVQWTDNKGLTIAAAAPETEVLASLSEHIGTWSASDGRLTVQLPGSDRYGSDSPASVLYLAHQRNSLYPVAKAMLEYWSVAGVADTEARMLGLCTAEYAQLWQRVSTGKAEQKALDTLNETIDTLKREAEKADQRLNDLAQTVQALSGGSVYQCDPGQLLLLFDPDGLLSDALLHTTVVGADAMGGEENHTGAVLDARTALADAWDGLRSAAAAYLQAIADRDLQESNYLTGTVSSTELLTAKCTALEREGDLYQAMRTCSRQAFILDELTGGVVTDTYACFGYIF